MDEMEKLKKECAEHEDFAIEANDILRELWNRDALPNNIKGRVAKLLEVPLTRKAI